MGEVVDSQVFASAIEVFKLIQPISIIIGILTFIFIYKQRNKHAKKRHTLDALLLIHREKSLKDAFFNILHKIDSKQEPPSGQAVDDRDLLEVLNFYEFLCAACRHGDIDVRLLRETRAGNIKSIYNWAQPYVRARQESTGKKKLYEHVQWFCENF